MEYIENYKQLHKLDAEYGADEVHIVYIAFLVEILGFKDLIDWGCGKGRLADSLLSLDVDCEKYDPAIEAFSAFPSGSFDCVISTDVLEHVPENELENFMLDITAASTNAILVPHLGLAKTILPDGSNAHCTIKSVSEWKQEFLKYYNMVEVLPHHSHMHRIFFCSEQLEMGKSAYFCLDRIAELEREVRKLSGMNDPKILTLLLRRIVGSQITESLREKYLRLRRILGLSS